MAPNRHFRRAETAKLRAAQSRCVSCERIKRGMTKEHFWPKWLFKFTNSTKTGVLWMSDRRVSPNAATIPICQECNNRLGSELEGPVSSILPTIEAGGDLHPRDLEFLVRWMWKFEGLWSQITNLDDHTWRYSDRWTVIDRVLGNAIDTIRSELTVALALTHENGENYEDWPMGLDTVSQVDAICVAGVFRKTAIIISAKKFAPMIPDVFGKYNLGDFQRGDGSTVLDPPPVCFPTSTEAVNATLKIGSALKEAHEAEARAQQATEFIHVVTPRIVHPNSVAPTILRP